MTQDKEDYGYVKAKLETFEQEMSEMRKDHKDMAQDIKALTSQITRYKGFIGGVVFLGTCIWAAVGAAWEAWKVWGHH